MKHLLQKLGKFVSLIPRLDKGSNLDSINSLKSDYFLYSAVKSTSVVFLLFFTKIMFCFLFLSFSFSINFYFFLSFSFLVKLQKDEDLKTKKL